MKRKKNPFLYIWVTEIMYGLKYMFLNHGLLYKSQLTIQPPFRNHSEWVPTSCWYTMFFGFDLACMNPAWDEAVLNWVNKSTLWKPLKII